jgi:hypothetical protein
MADNKKGLLDEEIVELIEEGRLPAEMVMKVAAD